MTPVLLPAKHPLQTIPPRPCLLHTHSSCRKRSSQLPLQTERGSNCPALPSLPTRPVTHTHSSCRRRSSQPPLHTATASRLPPPLQSLPSCPLPPCWQLLSQEEFAATFAYSDSIKDVIKGQGGRWVDTGKLWCFPMSKHAQVGGGFCCLCLSGSHEQCNATPPTTNRFINIANNGFKQVSNSGRWFI